MDGTTKAVCLRVCVCLYAEREMGFCKGVDVYRNTSSNVYVL